MRKASIFIKRTTFTVVLFYFLAGVAPLPAAEPSGNASITIVNNASLEPGQSLSLKSFYVIGSKERLVKKLAVGPVDDGCTNGCDAPATDFSGQPGTYRFELASDETPATASLTFRARAGDEFVWMISNRLTPPTSSEVKAGDISQVTDGGPYRIDLVAYAKTGSVAPKAAPVQRQPESKGFWPFKPKRVHSPANR